MTATLRTILSGVEEVMVILSGDGQKIIMTVCVGYRTYFFLCRTILSGVGKVVTDNAFW